MLKPATIYDGDLKYSRENSAMSDMDSLEDIESDIEDYLSIENELADENIFLTEVFENLQTLKQNSGNLAGLIKINSFISKFIDNLARNGEPSVLLILIESQLDKIKTGIFNWMYEIASLNSVKKIIEIINCLDEDRLYKYISYDKLRELLPIKFFTTYLSKPFSSNEEDVVAYDQIMSFQSLLLSVFLKVYFRSFMAIRPCIEASKIYSIDPFMRNEYRKQNIQYFLTNFWNDGNFEIYSFIEKIIEVYVLAALPRWQITEGEPLVVPLLEMIDFLFTYGLISYEFCKPLMRYLYLISETLRSIEQKIEMADKNIPPNQKSKGEFLKCRELMSAIIVHVFTIFSDTSLEESLLENLAVKQNVQYFKSFLLADKGSYNYFCSVVIKYLSSNLSIDGDVKSELLDNNLTLIYNFVGDFQKDSFVLSAELVDGEYFSYYLRLIKNKERSDRAYKTAVEITDDVTSFVKMIVDSKDEFGDQHFKNLLSRVSSLVKLFENDVFFKLELSARNIVSLWLSIIELLNDTNNEILIDDALITLGKILNGNYPGQSVLFRGEGYKSFLRIMTKHTLASLVLLRNVFEKNADLLYLSQDMFFLNLNIYHQKLAEFVPQDMEVGNYLASIDDMPDVKDKVIIMFFFNLYFSSLIEDHKIKLIRRKHYDTILAHYMLYFFKDYVMSGLDVLENASDFDDLLQSMDLLDSSIEQRKDILAKFSTISNRKLIFLFFYSTLKLFNKATYKLYFGEIWGTIIQNINSMSKSDMKVDKPQIIILKLEYVKLIERFVVFYPNHLVSKRTHHNPHSNLYLGENYIADNIDQIQSVISDEMKWFQLFAETHTSLNSDATEHVKKYLLKGFLPLIYKFLKGVSFHISKMLTDDLVLKIKTIVDLIADNMAILKPHIRRFLGQDSFKIKYEGIETFLKTSAFKSGNGELASLKLSGNKVKPIPEPNNDLADNVEERINPNLKCVRFVINGDIEMIDEFYKDSKYVYILARFVREPIKDETTKYMKKMFKSSEYLRKNMNYKKSLSQKITLFTSEDVIWKNLMDHYKNVKMSYQDNKESNQFYMVLKGTKDSKRNLKNIIRYFVGHFMDLEIEPKIGKHRFYFLNNEFFFSCLVIMDNLNVWNKEVKEVFLKLLKKFTQAEREKALTNLWSTYISLYLIVMFKTFMDDDWEIIWSLFYMLNVFWQHLVEENVPKFKLFLNKEKEARGAISLNTKKNCDQSKFSIFFENYIILENTANFTEFWLNYTPKIVPSDRAELFPIFKRLFSQVTEYINGPCLENQLKIYRFRIDLWNGIINRIVDDIDSKFYEVKLACLIFVKALMEGLDNDIITFMGSNLQINKLFTMIVRLTKKLYIRHLIYSQQVRKLSKIQNNIKNVIFDVLQFQNSMKNGLSVGGNAEITKEIEEKYQISTYKELIRMYKKYNASFSDHIILDVVITTYVMLVNMSFKLKIYEFFLKEKEKEAHMWQVKKSHFSLGKLDEIIIYLFLQNITANIEVVYDSAQVSKLMRLYYRVPPECLFLTQDSMDNFLKNVSYKSTQSKHIDLFDAVDMFQIEMKANKRYYEKYGGLYKLTTTDFFKYNQIVLYMMSILLNIIMLIYLSSSNVSNSILAASPVSGEQAIDILSYTIVILSGILTIFWLMFKYSTEVAMKYSKFLIYHKSIKKKDHLRILLLESLLIHHMFISFYLHFVFTIIGIILKNPFFYTLNLFLLTNLFKTVNYIMKSIVKHYGKLLITFVLTILVIFCYSFILLENFTADVNTENYDQYVCVDFLHCFLNSVNLGLRLGGGVSDALYLLGRMNSGGVFYGRFFFDLTFFILIKLIFLNLIAGIIIDTFSEMRDELTQRSYSLNNVCFICGKNKWQLEKDGIKFDVHIGKDHSLWKYLYYMIRLKSVKSTQLNGVEKYIYEKLSKDDSSWIPQNVYLKGHTNYLEISNGVIDNDQESDQVAK